MEDLKSYDASEAEADGIPLEERGRGDADRRSPTTTTTTTTACFPPEPPSHREFLTSVRVQLMCVSAHLAFLGQWHYPRLAYAALAGRALKVLATLCGAPVATPLYKLFYNRAYKRSNVLYDLLSPFNRRHFVGLRRVPYHIRSVVSMIGRERRGAVLLEFFFVLLQVGLFRVPAVLLPVTLLGVLLNAIPRQFYAQLKLLVRALHISYIDTTLERLLQVADPRRCLAVEYAGRRPFKRVGAPRSSEEVEEDADPEKAVGDEAPVREQPGDYLAFHGHHHSGCWAVVLSEAIDFAFSFLGGVLMLYLLAFSLLIGLEVLGVLDREDFEDAFPFFAVTVVRFAKSACNFVTTENLLRNAWARQGQHELYFFQRAVLLQRMYESPGDFVDDVAARRGVCPRSAIAFIGLPKLRDEDDYRVIGEPRVPALAMFSFLNDPDLHAQRFQDVLDDGVRLCGYPADLMNRDDKGRYPAPFDSDEQLDSCRQWTAQLLWSIFRVQDHAVCPGAGTSAHETFSDKVLPIGGAVLS